MINNSDTKLDVDVQFVLQHAWKKNCLKFLD
jgi:hypothetical protein